MSAENRTENKAGKPAPHFTAARRAATLLAGMVVLAAAAWSVTGGWRSAVN